MNRREFISRSTTATLGIGLGSQLFGEPCYENTMGAGSETSGAILSGATESVLTGTEPLTTQGDLAMQMVDGIHRFLMRETDRQAMGRAQLWSRDYTSADRYERS